MSRTSVIRNIFCFVLFLNKASWDTYISNYANPFLPTLGPMLFPIRGLRIVYLLSRSLHSVCPSPTTAALSPCSSHFLTWPPLSIGFYRLIQAQLLMLKVLCCPREYIFYQGIKTKDEIANSGILGNIKPMEKAMG